VFGIASFAQVPFSSLAGNVFLFDISEGFESADANTQVFAFLQSISEDSAIDDIDATAGDFYALVYEDTGLADSSTDLYAFLQLASLIPFPRTFYLLTALKFKPTLPLLSQKTQPLPTAKRCTPSSWKAFLSRFLRLPTSLPSSQTLAKPLQRTLT
jgi:hypothetical protein